MRKSKLLVLSMLAIGAIGLTSCGQAGPQGEKGETGAPGEKGETGAPGKDGKDGSNGSSVLNGEGAPKDTLGSDGDSYIDYSSFDYYVKENGKWVKKGNIKGAKGDDGEQGPKGDTGSKGEKGETGLTGGTGSRGPQGDTAWSNTILPTEGGYVTVDKGSATTKDYVTFKVYPDSERYITKFDLGNTSYIKDLLANKVEDHYEFKIKMQANGFVVSAEFSELGENVFYNKTWGILGKTLMEVYPEQKSGEVIILGTPGETAIGQEFEYAAITNEKIVIDLNGKTLTSKYQINLGAGVKEFTIKDSSTGAKGKLVYSPGTTDAEKAALAIKIGGEDYTELPKITIEEGISLETTAKYGILVDNTAKYLENYVTPHDDNVNPVKVELNVKGDVKTTATGGIALYVKGQQNKSENAKENIVVNVSGSLTADSGTGIKLNAGTLNVTDGSVSGTTGVYAEKAYKGEALKVNLTKGTIKGTDNSKGYAIYISDEVEYSISEDVRKNADGRISTPSMEVKSAADVLYALTKDNSNEIVVGSNITLELSEDMTITPSKNGWKSINANGYTVTIDLKGKEIDDTGEYGLMLKNGTFNIKDSTYTSETRTAIKSKITASGANVNAENVEFDGGFEVSHKYLDGNKFTEIENENVNLEFTNVLFYSPNYGFMTEDNENSNVTNCGTLKFNKCILMGYDVTNHNCFGALISSPYKTSFEECSFYGDRQCLIVRNSDVTVKDCTFYYNKGYTSNVETWGRVNDVPTAMIVVGNQNGSYGGDKPYEFKYYGDSKLTFVDTTEKGNKFNKLDGTTNYSSSTFATGDVKICIAYDGINGTEVNMTEAVSKELVDYATIVKSDKAEGSTKDLVIKVNNIVQVISNNKWAAKEEENTEEDGGTNP